MSIITNIGTWVKGWRLDKFFKGIENGDKEQGKNLQETTTKAVELVSLVIKELKNPTNTALIALVPGDWAEHFVEKSSLFLEKAANIGKLVQSCGSLQTPGEQLVCTYNQVIALGDKDEEDSFFHRLGVLAVKVFADGKLTWTDSIFAAEAVYQILIKPKNEAQSN